VFNHHRPDLPAVCTGWLLGRAPLTFSSLYGDRWATVDEAWITQTFPKVAAVPEFFSFSLGADVGQWNHQSV